MARVLSGRYELLEPLGRGGMGVVYRAHDRELERDVAIKLLPAQVLSDEDFRARFRREARAAAALTHPNIAAVYDIGEDASAEEPVPYLVMELVEGETLAALLRQAPPTPHQAAQIAVAVLDALEHSHERDVVHRDIKPANIMVHRANGRLRVKVMDFGIARLMSETATRLTATGMRIGTPSYMSPEQADGRPADARSDLYSLGCVLYEMLTGRPPFTGDSPTVVLFQHLTKTPEPPTQVNPALVPIWNEILATALAKNPAQRHPNAAAMRQAIETAIGTGSTAPTPQAPPLPPPGPDPATRPGAPTLTAPPAPTVPAADGPGPGRRPASEPTTPAAPRRVLTRRRLLAGAALAGLTAALPTSYYAFLRKDPAPFSRPLAGHTDNILSVAFSPDGKLLATGGWDDTARLWDVATATPFGRPLAGHNLDINSVAFSPDGKLLATGSTDKTVRLWDVANRTPLGEPLTGHTDDVKSVAFSPDGKLLATGSSDNTVRLWDVADRTPLGEPLTGHSDIVYSVAFSPDGKLLATGSNDNTVRLWDVADRAPLDPPLTGHTDSVLSVAFSPDGELLATGGWDKTVRLWDVNSSVPIGRPLDHDKVVASVAFSPDGKLLATGCAQGTVQLWDVATRTLIREPFTGHDIEVLAVAFSPDGKLLATAGDNTARLWQL